MAISIISYPQDYMPVYNYINLSTSSTKTSEEGFNFLFDVYVNGTYITRNKLQPYPGSINTTYSPASLLESYVSYDKHHNILIETPSINAIDKYEIHIGEEYIQYWNFFDTQYDSFSASSYTVLAGLTSSKHSFSVNDYINVSNTLVGTFNGTHKIVNIPNDHTVVINKTFISTPLNPGKATWSDHRKSVYIDNELVVNPGMTFSYAGWTSQFNSPYNNYISLTNFDNQLTMNVSDDTGVTYMTSTGSTTETLSPGTKYKVTFTTTSINNPSGGDQYVRVSLGGNLGTKNIGLGTFVETITCGAGTGLNVDLHMVTNTSIYGGHSTKIDNFSITLSPVSGYDFNGVIQYEEVPVWDYNKFNIGDITKKFLTNTPSVVKTTLLDRGSIGFMNIGATTPTIYSYVLNVEDISGVITSYSSPSSIIGKTTITNDKVINFPSNPWNINGGGSVITSTTKRYTIQIWNDSPDPVTELKTFELDHCGTRFEPVRFMFLNTLGQFDYYNATLLSRTTIGLSRDIIKKPLSRTYTQGDRGDTVINVKAQESYIINTDWISEETAHWLTYEFVTSNEIYVLDNVTGLLTPIVLTTSDWEDKKRVNDKLLNYTISYTKAVGLNTKRN